MSVASSPKIVCDLMAVIHQGRELVASLSDAEYGATPTMVHASSIGAHYRHHLEHVQLLLTGRPGGLVDYDDRERDIRIETDRAFALARTDELLGVLTDLDDDALDRALDVAHRTCTDDAPRVASSTLRRELLFLTSHAIHHYAIMKLVIELTGRAVDDAFGVMPSTLAHMAQKGCNEQSA